MCLNLAQQAHGGQLPPCPPPPPTLAKALPAKLDECSFYLNDTFCLKKKNE